MEGWELFLAWSVLREGKMKGKTEPGGLESSIPNGHAQNSTPGLLG